MDGCCQHGCLSVLEQYSAFGNAIEEGRNKFFHGASQSTSLLSSSTPAVNPFCCQGASCKLPVTFLAKWRATDSTILIDILPGRCNESRKVDNVDNDNN